MASVEQLLSVLGRQAMVQADAVEHWARLAREPALSGELREHCARNRDAVAALLQRAPV